VQTCEELRTKASLLEDAPDGDDKRETSDEVIEEDEAKWKKDEKSSTSSGNHEHPRIQVFRHIMTWRQHIMGAQGKQLALLKLRVKVAVGLLALLALLAFILLDLKLFNGMATYNMQRISKTGAFRMNILVSAYFVRAQQILAYRSGDDDETEAMVSKMSKYIIVPTLNELKHEHTINYEGALTGVSLLCPRNAYQALSLSCSSILCSVKATFCKQSTGGCLSQTPLLVMCFFECPSLCTASCRAAGCRGRIASHSCSDCVCAYFNVCIHAHINANNGRCV